MQAEIEKVKKRREERALEKARHEEEMASPILITYYWLSFFMLEAKLRSGYHLPVLAIFFYDLPVIPKPWCINYFFILNLYTLSLTGIVS